MASPWLMAMLRSPVTANSLPTIMTTIQAGAAPTSKGSPRLGLALVGLGIVWLLHSLGILQQPVFPILLIILGVYFIVRAK